MRERSQQLFDRAKLSIPGGVNSPVRSFNSVGGTPLFLSSAKGAYLTDADGNRYIDYINSWGPMIMGHGFEPVLEAVSSQVSKAISFGAPTELEIMMAELVKAMVPNVDLLRMVNSGTEACMSAIRLARGYTGRNRIIKFEGCYHGHADSFLVKAGSGVATLAIEQVSGVTRSVAEDTLIVAYNDLQAVEQVVARHPGQIAALIVEPVAGNMGCIPPVPGFLEGLRDICSREKIILIFDEVMTGFRLAPGGAQQRFNVWADLICFGKVIGGGLPVGAFGGKREIMEHIAPLGKVYQAGTLSGNPIAMAAGYALLSHLYNNSNVYTKLEEATLVLADGVRRVMQDLDLPHVVNQCGSMVSLHFSGKPVTNLASASSADNALFNRLFHHMLNNGVYLPPSAFESWFISAAIGKNEISHTLTAFASFKA